MHVPSRLSTALNSLMHYIVDIRVLYHVLHFCTVSERVKFNKGLHVEKLSWPLTAKTKFILHLLLQADKEVH
jgi:hypothetical protein